MNRSSGFLEKKQLRQHYQPIVDMRSLDLVRYEALLRPVGYSRSTEELVRNIEQTGQVSELDLWSLQSAVAKLTPLPGAPQVAINVSAVSICDPLFHEEVEWSLSQKAPHVNIGFEITESYPIGDVDLAKRFVKMVRRHGASVGLDDFGAGYAKFSVAEDLELDYLKLSSRLTTMVASNGPARTLIEKIVAMSKERGMAVVAEHVDNSAQYAWLRNANIDLGQGWLFAKDHEDIEINRNYRKSVVNTLGIIDPDFGVKKTAKLHQSYPASQAEYSGSRFG